MPLLAYDKLITENNNLSFEVFVKLWFEIFTRDRMTL